MKATDRNILVAVALIGVIAAFWFVILSPKREEASQLEATAATLESSVANLEALAAEAEAAEANFDHNYESLVVLGKAVPSDSDTSSLFVQLGEIANETGVDLGTIELTEGGSAPLPPPPAAATTADDAPKPGAESDGAATSVPVDAPAAPTEAAASTLPLGATVGSAGLPVMPYQLAITGSFFELANFLKSVDELVGYANAKPDVHGRLLTIDGFNLTPVESEATTSGTKAAPTADGDLTAELAITSYVSPAEQGLTAGATPAGPAPPATTPVSSTAPPPSTAAVLP